MSKGLHVFRKFEARKTSQKGSRYFYITHNIRNIFTTNILRDFRSKIRYIVSIYNVAENISNVSKTTKLQYFIETIYRKKLGGGRKELSSRCEYKKKNSGKVICALIITATPGQSGV